MNAVVRYLDWQRGDAIVALTPGTYRNLIFHNEKDEEGYRSIEMDLYLFSTSTRNLYFEILNALAFVIYDDNTYMTIYDYKVMPLSFTMLGSNTQHIVVKVKGFEVKNMTRRGVSP